MNQLVPAAPRALSAMIPANMREAMDLAGMMAKGRLVPQALQDKPADCLLVIECAMRWGMSPFAVAQEVAVVKGRLMFSGKIVAAAINSSPLMGSRLDYEFSGQGDDRRVVVTGTIRGVPSPKTVELRLGDVRTENENWRKQPDQQLSYIGARVWSRRWLPEVMLGVAAPEDVDDVTPEAPRFVENHASETDALAGTFPPAPAAPPVVAPAGSMREHAAQVTGREFIAAEDPEPEEGLPLLYADGRLVTIRAGQKSGAPAITLWLRAVGLQLASLESPRAVHDWRRENGAMFGSIAQTYAREVSEAERAIEARLALFAGAPLAEPEGA